MPSPATSSATDLGARYGAPSRPLRLVAIVIVAALVLAGLGFVGWAAFSTSTPQVQSRLTFFAFPGEHLAVADITVSRESTSTVATCVLTAIADDHSVVGQQEVTVRSGPRSQTLRVRIETERKATTVDSPGCTTPDQSRPR